jgi:hypothetical protein
MSKRKEPEMESEESDAEEVTAEEEEEEEKTTYAAVLHRILQNEPPLSEIHPGYLLGFVAMLETQTEDLPVELENSLRHLTKAAKVWNNGISRASKKGVIEYLESCKGLMGNSFAISFGSKTTKSIKTFLDAFKEMSTTNEDCCRYVERTLTSTLPTTAATPTERVGATGSKKQKLMDYTTDEINVELDEIRVEVEPCPTFKTYSSITARKDGKLYCKRLEEKWKEFHAKVTIYRRTDLLDCSKHSNKWEHRWREMEVNYNTGGPISNLMNQMGKIIDTNLDKKDVGWEPKKNYSFTS